MSRFRIVFMGTPDFAVPCLEHLLLDKHFQVVGVVTQPDRPAGRKLLMQPSPIKQLALAHKLNLLTPEKINNDQVLADIAAWGADCAVVVAFGQILSQKLLDSFQFGCVNVHASILPRWRGAAPIQRAIQAGDKETGVSLQVVVKKLDAGPVLGFRKMPIDSEMTAPELYEKLKLMGPELLHVELMDYLRGNLVPQKQDESLVTIAAKIDKSEAFVDWKWSAEQIHNHVRAMAAGPVAQCRRQGALLKLHNVKVAYLKPKSASPGEIVAVQNDSFFVACGSGTALQIFEVQPESRARMKVPEYLRGYALQVGDFLT